MAVLLLSDHSLGKDFGNSTLSFIYFDCDSPAVGSLL